MSGARHEDSLSSDEVLELQRMELEEIDKKSLDKTLTGRAKLAAAKKRIVDLTMMYGEALLRESEETRRQIAKRPGGDDDGPDLSSRMSGLG